MRYGDFARRVLPAPSEIVFLGSDAVQFIFVAISDVGNALRKFRLEPEPVALLVGFVFFEKHSECFFCGQLGNASEVPHSESL